MKKKLRAKLFMDTWSYLGPSSFFFSLWSFSANCAGSSAQTSLICCKPPAKFSDKPILLLVITILYL